MEKFYGRLQKPSMMFATLLWLAVAAVAQPSSRHVYMPANAGQPMLLQVKKGDVVEARAEAGTPPRSHILSKVLGVLGIAAATYQVQGIASPQPKLVGVKNRPYPLPGIGLAAGAAAWEILGTGRGRKTRLRYAFYNKDTALVATGTAGRPKKRKLQLKAIAPADGFVQVAATGRDAAMVNAITVDITAPDSGVYLPNQLVQTNMTTTGGGGGCELLYTCGGVCQCDPCTAGPPADGPTSAPTGGGGVGIAGGGSGGSGSGGSWGSTGGGSGGGTGFGGGGGTGFGGGGGTGGGISGGQSNPCIPYSSADYKTISEVMANVKAGSIYDVGLASSLLNSLSNFFTNSALGITPIFSAQTPPGYTIGSNGGFYKWNGNFAAAITIDNTIYISPYAASIDIYALIGYISHEEAHVYVNSILSDMNITTSSPYFTAVQEYIAYSYESMYYSQIKGEESNQKATSITAQKYYSQLPPPMQDIVDLYLNKLKVNPPKYPC